jgi:ABC-type multidrug transport system fused ATPase/permease subunit
MSISGGEAQRLSLARLMVQPPKLLILDEPTEHLDEGSATEISGLIDTLTAHTARILITHTVTSIQDEDLVLVLCAGEVAACGYPAELRSEGGWFAERWREEALQKDMTGLIADLPIGRGVSQSRRPAAGCSNE